MSSVPPEIWARIFQTCILDLSDWEEQRRTDAKSRSATIFDVSQSFHTGARNLALVCRRWAGLVTSDNHLKFIKVLVMPDWDYEDGRWVEEIEKALSSSPLCAIHLYISVDLSPRFVHLLRTHSARIQLLALYSYALSRIQLETLGSTIFPQLRYFSSAFLSRFRSQGALEMKTAADASVLSAFIKNHSSSLRLLWLDDWASSPVYISDISYSITQLHLHLGSSRTDHLSLPFVCGLLKACPGLERLFLYTRALRREYETELNLVSEGSTEMVASNLRECALSTNPILLLQILCYVSMPRLEALRIDQCISTSRIHSHSLHLLTPVQFPSLKIANFDPLGPLLADFVSIATFPCLQELSVDNRGRQFNVFMKECALFPYCNTLLFLHLRGSYEFQTWILRNLASGSNRSLWSLSIDPLAFLERFERCQDTHLSDNVPTIILGTIQSLVLETGFDISGNDLSGILKALPNLEILTLDIPKPRKDSTRLISSLHSDLKHDLLLPRLKTLKIFFKGMGKLLLGESPQIKEEQCKQLQEYLHNRLATGRGLETLICNGCIIPQMAASMNQCAGAIIHGGKSEYPDHQYHVFPYDMRAWT